METPDDVPARWKNSHGPMATSLRRLAMIAIVTGAAGSLGLMFYFGRGQRSLLLIVLFTVWVASPFLALAWAHAASKGSIARKQTVVALLTLVIAVASLTIYGVVTFGPPRPEPARFFILTPAASWLLIFVTGVCLFRAVAIVASTCGLAIAALFAFLWLERTFDTELPSPTGPLHVGRALFDWRDDTTIDALAPRPGVHREVLAWIWYPAAATKSGQLDDYVPPYMRAAAKPMRGPFRFVTREASKVHAHSLRDADLSPQQHAYPVVILRGGASTSVAEYTTLAEDLASHGYIVVGIDAPYRTGLVAFPDGRSVQQPLQNNPELHAGADLQRFAARVMAAWISDMSFVVDRLSQLNAADPTGRFTGRLDMTRIGAFGHSFGGAQAAQFCHDDARCKAAIDIDGAPLGTVVNAGMQKPFMLVQSSEGDFSTDAETREILSNVRSLFAGVPADRRLWVSIGGANHFMFTDDGAVRKSMVVRGFLRAFGRLKISGRRQLAVTAYCVHRFFDAYLKDRRLSRLDISSPLYAEIRVVQ